MASAGSERAAEDGKLGFLRADMQQSRITAGSRIPGTRRKGRTREDTTAREVEYRRTLAEPAGHDAMAWSLFRQPNEQVPCTRVSGGCGVAWMAVFPGLPSGLGPIIGSGLE